MPQKVALLICANPRLIGRGASVYIPFGAWKVDLSGLISTKIHLEAQSIHAEEDENWEHVPLNADSILEEQFSAMCIRVAVDIPGKEDNITITLEKCH